MKKYTIALLSGGISSEREVSLKGGDQVESALDREKYNVLRYDPKCDIPEIIKNKDNIDFALFILHGPFGEDGTIQGLMDILDIPYQGSGVLGSSIAMNKVASKRLYTQAGLDIPGYLVVDGEKPAVPGPVVEKLGLPLVIKPVSAGSSQGMTLARDMKAVEDGIDLAMAYDSQVILEEYIQGRELTCGVLGNRDKMEALPVIEIIPEKGHEFFDYESKYIPGACREICPAQVDEEVTRLAMETGITAHNALFLEGYSRTDMILSEGRVYVLETNTIPGMTKTSLFPQSAQAAGLSFSALLDRLIELGMEAHQMKKMKTRNTFS